MWAFKKRAKKEGEKQRPEWGRGDRGRGKWRGRKKRRVDNIGEEKRENYVV